MNKAQIISLIVFCVPIIFIIVVDLINKWECYKGNHKTEFENNVNGYIMKCKRCGRIIH